MQGGGYTQSLLSTTAFYQPLAATSSKIEDIIHRSLSLTVAVGKPVSDVKNLTTVRKFLLHVRWFSKPVSYQCDKASDVIGYQAIDPSYSGLFCLYWCCH